MTLETLNLTKSFGGLCAVDDVSFYRLHGRTYVHNRPQRRRQDHRVQPADRVLCA